MHKVDLRRIDLNLLVVLEALLEEKNVTRAGARLGMSQPAASRALGRLRNLFSDALLVDGQGGYILSARAEQIQPDLRQMLAGIGAIFDARQFRPDLAEGTLRLVMTDLHAAVLVPPMLSHLAGTAPNIDLDIIPPGPSPLTMLIDNKVDAIIGVPDTAPAGIHQRTLFKDSYVTLMREGHPSAGQPLTLENYLALEHIVISVTGSGSMPIDDLLSGKGLRRRVRVRVPNFLSALEIAAESDLIMTLPDSLARTATASQRFVSLPPPIDLGNIDLELLWHAMYHDSSRHRWLRSVVVSAAKHATKKN